MNKKVIAERLRSLGSAFVAAYPTLPFMEPVSRFVNGRGQILESLSRSVPDSYDAISSFLYSPDHSYHVEQAINALIHDTCFVRRVRLCDHDGGAAYIQSTDPDRSALTEYFLRPLLGTYAGRRPDAVFDFSCWDEIAGPVLDALWASEVECVLTTPVLGVRLDHPLDLGPEIQLRAPSYQEEVEWREDDSLEPSMSRDILVAEAVVHVDYVSSWDARASRYEESECGKFDDNGYLALESASTAIAVLRIVTGRDLPLVFSTDQIVSIPWAKSRFSHLPTLKDTVRRFEKSPVFVSVVEAEPLSESEIARSLGTWKTVRSIAPRHPDVLRAVRLFLHDRDYVNLYRIFEIIREHAGSAMKAWATNDEMKRFTQTANSSDAVGDSWSRHGRRFSAPRTPMDLDTADALVRKLLMQWVETANAGH